MLRARGQNAMLAYVAANNANECKEDCFVSDWIRASLL